MDTIIVTEETAHEAARMELDEAYDREVGGRKNLEIDLARMEQAAESVLKGETKPIERLSFPVICRCLAFSSAFEYRFEDESGNETEDTDFDLGIVKDQELACRALDKLLLNAAARAKEIGARVYDDIIAILSEFHFMDKSMESVFATLEASREFQRKVLAALHKLWAENAVFETVHSVHTKTPPSPKKGQK